MHILGICATFFGNTCTTDLSAVFRKFYCQFNNILSVLGGSANKMFTLHIVKTHTHINVWLRSVVVVK